MTSLHLWQCYTIISIGLLHSIDSQCTAGNDETGTTSTNPIFGMVLNIDDRAECTGHIGTLEYTYYQGPRINNQNRDFVSSVSVWSQSSSVYNLRGSRQYSSKASGNPVRNRDGTVNVIPPLFIKKGEVIGIYIAAPQGSERDVTFVADGSGNICVNGSSGNSISCSILNGKILRAKATITPITCSIPALTNGRVSESPCGPLLSSPPLINDIVYYKCNPGYRLTGPSLSECVLNGETGAFNETVPTCQNEIIPNLMNTSSSLSMVPSTQATLITGIQTPSTYYTLTLSSTTKEIPITTATQCRTTYRANASDDSMTTTSDEVHTTSTIDSPTVTTEAGEGENSSNITLIILGTSSGTALIIALLVLGTLVTLFTVFITKRRNKGSHNMIENPCCNIDELYQTVQEDSSDNNERRHKNETRVICSIISEYDEPQTGSDMHHNNAEEYEMPVMVGTNSHSTEPSRTGAALPPVAKKPTRNEVPGYFTLEEGEHYYRHLKQVMTEKEKEIKYTHPGRNEGQLYMQLCHAKQIESDSIVLDSRLGSGQFGEVYKGRLGDKVVAIKLMKEGSSHEERVKFLQEAVIMRQFNNLNIVKMHGIVYENEKAMIVMELLENGDLQNYLLKLKRNNRASPYQLLNFCRQICLGMTYLSGKGFIHCDLAARNVLLSKENICKIADFGMSCDLEDDEVYYYSKGGKIPIKWMAPEAVIKRKYSSASDVWSYGCVLYEIWSLGHKPFETYSNIYALEKVKDGYRLPPPPGCPRSIYKHMIQCWHPIPRERPDFDRLMLSMLQLESEENDELPSPEAGQLGGDLEAGEMLYPDLQNAYRGMKINYK